MNLPQAVRSVFVNYANFAPRASRSEFWYFKLFNFIAVTVTLMLDQSLKTNGIVTGLYALITFVPLFALSVRRMHDIGRRGRWLLLIFVPVIGSIWLLVLLCTPSDAEKNMYGPRPA